MSEFEFPNGSTLLYVLAERISKKFPELLEFEAQAKVVEAASKVSFSSLLHQLQHFESGLRLIESELLCSGSHAVLSNFLSSAEMEISQLRETLDLASNQLSNTMEFFGEHCARMDGEKLQPEEFFKAVAEFSAKLFESLRKMNG